MSQRKETECTWCWSTWIINLWCQPSWSSHPKQRSQYDISQPVSLHQSSPRIKSMWSDKGNTKHSIGPEYVCRSNAKVHVPFETARVLSASFSQLWVGFTGMSACSTYACETKQWLAPVSIKVLTGRSLSLLKAQTSTLQLQHCNFFLFHGSHKHCEHRNRWVCHNQPNQNAVTYSFFICN